MRTTIEIDDQVLAAARSLARDERISLGAAVSLLAARGLRAVEPVQKTALSFPVFDIDLGAPPITLDLVLQHRDE